MDAAAVDYYKCGNIKQGQSNGNYKYDKMGNLVSYASESASNITCNVYGKKRSITKSGNTTNFTYDAAGLKLSILG